MYRIPLSRPLPRPRLSVRPSRALVAAVLTTGAVAAATLASAGPAQAAVPYPGSGFVVNSVSTMTTTLTVPTITCTRNENSAAVFGLMGTQVGTIDGWNAAVVAGCNLGHPWYRIQAWVNAVGGA